MLGMRKLVFDIDDTCRPLGRVAAELSGIPYEKIVEFQALKNPALNEDERLRFNEVLHDYKTYEQVEFYPGFERLAELQRYGAEVYFRSNGFSQEINDLKREQILAKLPDFPLDHMQFFTIDDNTTTHKVIGDDTFIAFEDNPYVVEKSLARFNVVPEMPWNITKEAKLMMGRVNYTLIPAGQMSTLYEIAKYFLLRFRLTE